MSEIDMKYVVNVRECMLRAYLPKPKHRSKFIYNDGEFLPIITVECEV